jgi:hypothetical protein
MENKKQKIKDILNPHFGYLNLYLKWSEKVSINKIEEFNNFIKSNKELIKKLPKPLNSYNSYNSAISDIHRINKETKLKRLYKDNLNGTARKLFEKTFDTYKSSYLKLSKNPFKLEMFFRNSSKPKTIEEYSDYLKSVLKFDNNIIKIVQKIEKDIDYLRTSNGGYLFELKPEHLKMVPTTWCIHDSPSQLTSELTRATSIWLCVDPYNEKQSRRLVGIDYMESETKYDLEERKVKVADKRYLLYMDSMNRRFEKNVPITEEEFFKITRSRLKSRLPDLEQLPLNEQMEIQNQIEKYNEVINEQYEKIVNEHQVDVNFADSLLKIFGKA